MKYYIDQEFIEGFHKPLLGKRRHFIDLISIGIVCEDGREYYAISNDFDPKDADEWVRNNVLASIWDDLQKRENNKRARLGLPHFGDYSGQFTNKQFKYLLKVYGKSNKQIAEEIRKFTMPYADDLKIIRDNPEFYGYYSDYDWVLFCSLFGRMIDLPQGFPMYCIDLKQSLDEAIDELGWDLEGIKKYKSGYPEQENEHHALEDAKWNKKLHEYIQTL